MTEKVEAMTEKNDRKGGNVMTEKVKGPYTVTNISSTNKCSLKN